LASSLSLFLNNASISIRFKLFDAAKIIKMLHASNILFRKVLFVCNNNQKYCLKRTSFRQEKGEMFGVWDRKMQFPLSF